MTAYIKIATFAYAYEYAVLRLMLEQAKVRFFFQNETAITTIPFYTNPKGGIFLKVHPEDEVQAKQILADFNAGKKLHIV